MSTLENTGNWNIIKGQLQQRWAELTDDDLQYYKGKRGELIGRIQKRTGETREAVETAIRDAASYFSSIRLPILSNCSSTQYRNGWLRLGLWAGAIAIVATLAGVTVAVLGAQVKK